MSKVLLLGIPGFDGGLAQNWLEDLPNLKKMMAEGIWGKMSGAVPPNRVTAWTCALSGRNPGVFGFWGLSYRESFVYGEPKTIDGTTKERRVNSLYNILPNLGQKTAIIGVPLTWPPPRIPGGYSVSTPFTPGDDKGFTWPKSLADEIRGLVGEFLFEQGDEDPHPEERDRVFERICEIDEQRFTLVKHLLGKKQCDCVIAAFSGLHKLARLYNGGYDRNREQDPQRMSMLREYYRWLDRQIGEVRSALDPATVLLVVSVHNVERLDGEIHINEWLIQNGYLSVSQYPDEPTAIADVNVEWAKTKAWASGDSGQVYVNLKGREADGIVDSAEYETLLDELISRLKEIPDENGNPLNTRLFKRHEIYSGPFSQYAPDLFIAFDGCRRKCGEKVGFGSGSLYSSETAPISARGSDGLEGFFCIAGPGIPPKGEYVGASLLDVAPTVLDVMDLEIPGELEGVSVSGKKRTPEEEEALVQERLKFLGY